MWSVRSCVVPSGTRPLMRHRKPGTFAHWNYLFELSTSRETDGYSTTTGVTLLQATRSLLIQSALLQIYSGLHNPMVASGRWLISSPWSSCSLALVLFL